MDLYNKGGREPKYETPEEMQPVIQEYFELKWAASEKPTITGLALALGFEARQSIYDYGDKPEFSYTIKRAQLAVEDGNIKQLYSRNPTGAIFLLKSVYGYQDKQIMEITGDPDKPIRIDVLKNVSIEDL